MNRVIAGKSMIVALGMGLVQQMASRSKVANDQNLQFSQVCDSNDVKEGQLTATKARGPVVMTRLNGQVYAVQQTVVNDLGKPITSNVSADYLIGDRVFDLDTLDGYGIKDGFADQFSDQFTKRYLLPYHVNEENGKIQLSQNTDITNMDSSLTDWIARGNVITKTVVVGNTSLAYDCIRSLRANEHNGIIVHIPGNSKQSHVNSLNAEIATWLAKQIAGVPDISTPLSANGYPDEQFKKFYKVQTVGETIDGFDLRKKQLVVNGNQIVYYNNLFITPFGEIANQSNQGYLATQEDFERLAENLKQSTNIDLSIDKLTPKTLEFGLALQNELQKLNQANVTLTYNVVCTVCCKQANEYLMRKVKSNPKIKISDYKSPNHIITPQYFDYLEALETDLGEDVLNSSIEGQSYYDFAYVAGPNLKTLHPYNYNSGIITGFNILHKHVPQMNVKYFTAKLDQDRFYQVGVCDNNSSILNNQSNTDDQWMVYCYKGAEVQGAISLNKPKEILEFKELLTHDMHPDYASGNYMEQVTKKFLQKKNSKRFNSRISEYLKQPAFFYYR